MNLLSALVRHERRIRLLFSAHVGSGAFSASRYAVTSTDARGADPAVSAALVVPGNPSAVELALSLDLAQGSVYRVQATSVPPLDSVHETACSSAALFSLGMTQQQPNEEMGFEDIDAVLYGVDLAITDGEFVETGGGDLAADSGPAMVMNAAKRRLASEGLAWDRSYGGAMRPFVDAPMPTLARAATVASAQCKQDDRIVGAKATMQSDDGDAMIHLALTLTGDTETEGDFSLKS